MEDVVFWQGRGEEERGKGELSIVNYQLSIMNYPMKSAKYWIEKLQLQPHPEGGYYRETYRAKEGIKPGFLPEKFVGERQFITSIYFLLQNDDFSGLHRLKSDEIWYFHQGSSLMIHIIDDKGTYSQVQLGEDWEKGEHLQVSIPADHWFGATLNHPHSYALVGCSVAPGFDFRDFELGGREALTQLYPHHRLLIEQLTRG